MSSQFRLNGREVEHGNMKNNTESSTAVKLSTKTQFLLAFLNVTCHWPIQGDFTHNQWNSFSFYLVKNNVEERFIAVFYSFIIHHLHKQYNSNIPVQMQHVFAQAEAAADVVVVAHARFTPPLKSEWNGRRQLRLQDGKQSLSPIMYRVKCLRKYHRKR